MPLIEIFKGSKVAQMYIYVDRKDGLDKVPDELLARFGSIESVMLIKITAEKKLAQVCAKDVLSSIENQGFFVQMPPSAANLVETQIAAMIYAEEKLNSAQQPEPGK